MCSHPGIRILSGDVCFIQIFGIFRKQLVKTKFNHSKSDENLEGLYPAGR